MARNLPELILFIPIVAASNYCETDSINSVNQPSFRVGRARLQQDGGS